MKVLIADDEPDVRAGLKTIIDWKGLGFEICGEASNGIQCLQKILDLNPDLVLLDIRMPKMHGLECAKAARGKGWNGKIIILSGYSDFQYAQSAIRCGVETYLLKPIDEDELTDSVRQIRKKIEKERNEFQQRNLVLEKARNTVLRDILLGKTFPGNTYENIGGLALKADRYLVVIPEKRSPDFPGSCTDRELDKLFRSQPVEKIKADRTDIYLFKGSETIQKFNKILDSVRRGIFLAVGREVDSIHGISLSYRDAAEIYSRRFFYGSDQAVIREKIPHPLEPCDFSKADLHHCVEKLCCYIQACNGASLCKLLDGLSGRLTTLDIKPGYVLNMLITICIQVKNFILENFRQEDLELKNDAELISRINRCQRLYEIIDLMKKDCTDIIMGISLSQGNRLTDRMKAYIENSYSKSFNLESLAQTFGYNSAYLGKVFKNDAGESFHSYLDRIRIQHAKKLLAGTNLKVYEISQRVGYENIDYFYLKFHKYEGKSPLEFRKNVKQKA